MPLNWSFAAKIGPGNGGQVTADLEKKVVHCLRNTKADDREPMYHQNSKGLWGYRIAKANVLAFFDPPVGLDE